LDNIKLPSECVEENEMMIQAKGKGNEEKKAR
jgi:hypothetical protein